MSKRESCRVCPHKPLHNCEYLPLLILPEEIHLPRRSPRGTRRRLSSLVYRLSFRSGSEQVFEFADGNGLACFGGAVGGEAGGLGYGRIV